MSPVLNGLGLRILRVRRRLRLSQVAFAARIGVHRNSLRQVERGRVPHADVLDRIARHGGVTVEWLLHGEGARLVQRDKAWRDAVELLGLVWRDPARRPTVVSVLEALRPP